VYSISKSNQRTAHSHTQLFISCSIVFKERESSHALIFSMSKRKIWVLGSEWVICSLNRFVLFWMAGLIWTISVCIPDFYTFKIVHPAHTSVVCCFVWMNIPLCCFNKDHKMQRQCSLVTTPIYLLSLYLWICTSVLRSVGVMFYYLCMRYSIPLALSTFGWALNGKLKC